MPITTDDQTFDSADDKLRSECQLEIEQLWMSGEDPKAVHRLARAHPELAEELYDFFAFMIDTHEGVGRRRPAASPPKPFLALLRTTGQTVQAIAESMEITPDFLVDLSDHGTVLPLDARQELVRRARVAGAIDETDAIASFDVRSLRRAASRKTAFTVDTVTFEGLVKRSSLSPEQKRFWLGFA